MKKIIWGVFLAFVLATNSYAGTKTPAKDITVTPVNNITSTDVQAALQEVDTKKQPLNATLTLFKNTNPSIGYTFYNGTSYVYIPSTNVTWVETDPIYKNSTWYNTTNNAVNWNTAYNHTSLINNPHNVTKAQVGLGVVDNTTDIDKPISNATQQALNSKVDSNVAIVAGNYTKIYFDTKGLVTSGENATTSDISDSADRRYVNDTQRSIIINTTGSNTGDETQATIKSKLGSANNTTDGYVTTGDWNIFNNKQPALGFTPENNANKGVANGYAPLNNSTKIDTTYLPTSIIGAMKYQGAWNCTPGLYPVNASQGNYWVSSAAGLVNGTQYYMGDWLAYNGASWDRIDNQQTVTSVNSQVGAVNLTQDNVGNGITYKQTHNDFTDALKGNYDTAYNHTSLTNNPHNVTKTQIGLSNVTDVAQEPAIASGSSNAWWIGNKTWEVKNTTNVPEGDNLYFNNSRARASLSSSNPITYNSTSGAIGWTNSNNYITLANLSGGSGISYNSTTGVINATAQSLSGNISGTTNQVNVTANTNSTAQNITISLPQNITIAGNMTASNFVGNYTETDPLSLHLNQTIPQNITGGKPIVQGLQFDTNPTVGNYSEGKLYYDTDWKTLSANIDGDVNLQIGQEELRRVFNNGGSTILNGKAVYTSGSHVDTYPYVATVGLAVANDSSKYSVLGIATQNITNGTYGFVTVRGHVNQIDTSAFTNGDVLYLSDTTPGELTASLPSPGNYKMRVGRCIFSNATNGTLNVRLIYPYKLGDLSNVVETSPTLDQVIRYNGVEWVNGAPTTSSASAGIDFFHSTPQITANGTSNNIALLTLSKTPVTTAEQVKTVTVGAATVPMSAWIYNTSLGRTSIDAGIWNFHTYAAVSSTTGGRISNITRQVYSVLTDDGSTYKANITGTGTTRQVLASGGTPFNTTNIVASATNTDASYLQTPLGLYQVVTRVNDTAINVTTPSGYGNETAVDFSVWKKLFGVTTPTITTTGTNYADVPVSTAQSAFNITTNHKLGSIAFGTSNTAGVTVSTTYDGTTRNSMFSTPLITLHNNLAGLQGGNGAEEYHLTSAQHTVATQSGSGSVNGYLSTSAYNAFNGKADYSFGANNFTGTGNVTAGTFIGNLTGNVTGNITGNSATVTGLNVTAGKTLTVTSNATIAGTPVLGDGTVNPTNLLSNHDFEAWSAGNAGVGYGDEFVINGIAWTGASGATGPNNWTQEGGSGTYDIISGALRIIWNSGGGISQVVTLIPGNKYIVSVDLKNINAGYGMFCNIGTVGGGFQYGSLVETGTSVFVTHTLIFTATQANCYISIGPNVNGTQGGLVDNCSLKAVAWNAPDGWILATGTVAREASTIKSGTYSAKLTTSAGLAYIEQNVAATKGIDYWKSKTLTLSAWVYATVANRARIAIADGIDNTYSSYHPGDSAWHLLTVTRTLVSNATVVKSLMLVDTGDTSAYFDAAMLTEGDSVFAASPKPAEEGVWADYGATSTFVGWSGFTAKELYVKKIGTRVFVSYNIVGTSNSATTTCTLPYAASSLLNFYSIGYVNAAGTEVGGLVVLGASSDTISFYSTISGVGFTNSGVKNCRGQFSYECA